MREGGFLLLKLIVFGETIFSQQLAHAEIPFQFAACIPSRDSYSHAYASGP